jgi:hypothetical protein
MVQEQSPWWDHHVVTPPTLHHVTRSGLCDPGAEYSYGKIRQWNLVGPLSSSSLKEICQP